jgi:ribosomal protein S18 acetylase RimI-like enzyme
MPADAGAWEPWLRDVRATFESLERRPHLWVTAGFGDPRLERLERAGFATVGASRYMFLRDRTLVDGAGLRPAGPPRTELERIDTSTTERTRAARDVAAVIADAFDLDPAFQVLVEHDVLEMLDVEAISFVLVRLDGEPAAVARRTTDDGASLLAAIGTRRAFRRRGLGRLVTATATRDALAAGSETVFLGVEDGNDGARHLYETLGYAMAEGGMVALLQR